MKKIFMTFSTATTFIAAVVLTSCNNAEEVKKQTEAQAASIQTAVDEKLNSLQAEVDAECVSLIDSLANVEYTAYLEEAKKSGKKVAVKPKPKASAKKEEPKTGLGTGKVGTTQEPAKIGEGKIGVTKDTVKLGKGKLGTQTPK